MTGTVDYGYDCFYEWKLKISLCKIIEQPKNVQMWQILNMEYKNNIVEIYSKQEYSKVESNKISKSIFRTRYQEEIDFN